MGREPLVLAHVGGGGGGGDGDVKEMKLLSFVKAKFSVNRTRIEKKDLKET